MKTRVDKLIDKCKNHKWLSLIIVATLILIAVGNITESLSHITHFVRGETRPTPSAQTERLESKTSKVLPVPDANTTPSRGFIDAERPKLPLRGDAGSSRYQVLSVVYNSNPPAPSSLFSRPKFQFVILARRKNAPALSAVEDGDSLTPQDKYIICGKALTSGYLYIFQIDSAGQVQWLFPENTECSFSGGHNPVEMNNSFQLPATSDEAYTLDNISGVEHVYVVCSNTRWPQLESILSSIPTTTTSPQHVQWTNSDPHRGILETKREDLAAFATNTLFVQRTYEGDPYSLSVPSPPIESAGYFFVIERWFYHTSPQ